MLDAPGQALAYVYAREPNQQAQIANVLSFDAAGRIAVAGRKPSRANLSEELAPGVHSTPVFQLAHSPLVVPEGLIEGRTCVDRSGLLFVWSGAAA